MGEHGVNAIRLKPLSTYELIPELYHHKAQANDKARGVLKEAHAIANDYDLTLHTKPFETAPSDPEHSESRADIVGIMDLKKRSRDVVQESTEKEKRVRPGVYQPARDRQFEHNGTACMEPFNTLYASFDGDVHRVVESRL